MPENTTPAPEGFVTSEELIVRGISADVQRRGRHGGDLPYAQVGADRFAYKKADVDAWLQGEVEANAKSGRAIRQYVAGRDAKQATAIPAQQVRPIGGSGPRAAADEAGPAKASWQAAVDRLVSSGMSKRDAITQVDKSQANLRLAMLREHNGR
jgi:hypothetical protein